MLRQSKLVDSLAPKNKGVILHIPPGSIFTERKPWALESALGRALSTQAVLTQKSCIFLK